MAKELWVKCTVCNTWFQVLPDEQRKAKVDQIIAGRVGVGLVATCPKGHTVTIDSSDKERVSVRGT